MTKQVRYRVWWGNFDLGWTDSERHAEGVIRGHIAGRQHGQRASRQEMRKEYRIEEEERTMTQLCEVCQGELATWQDGWPCANDQHCKRCGLVMQYDPKLHECRKGPRKMAGSWLDEVKEKQGIDHWKEEAGR